MTSISVNFDNEKFYKDMLNITNNKNTVDIYINENFSNFWSSFYSFLSIFHQQVRVSSFLRRSPKVYLFTCFDVIRSILKEAKIEDYNKSMKEDMTKCFKSMLHPNNLDSIKQKALEFFIIIYPRLRKSQFNYTEDFEQYFFDFSFLDTSLKITSIEYEINIRETENTKSFDDKLTDFLEKISENFTTTSDTDDMISWWIFIQKYIIGIVYYSIFKKKPEIQGISIIENLTLKIESIIIDFLIKIFKTDILKDLIEVENTSSYIIDILSYVSHEDMISKINLPSFIEQMLSIFADPTTQFSLINIFNEQDHHLLLELMSIYLNYLNYAFESKKFDQISKTTKEIYIYFSHLLEIFNDEYKYEFCSYISKNTKLTNINCLFHFLSLLLSLFINNRIVDKKLWSTIVDFTNSSDMKETLSIILICYSYFAGYYSTFVFLRLLDLNESKLTESMASTNILSNFLNLDNILWLNEFTDILTHDYLNMFSNQRSKLIHSSILATPGIEEIKLQQLFPNENREIPPKEEVLQLLRAMFSSFVWQDKKYESDEEIQFYCYLVCASFITPLIKISNSILPSIDFDRNFLIEEFLPYLKNCMKPTVSNLLIKLHALLSLGSIICKKTSLNTLDENNLADWYLTLHNFIINGGDNKDDDNESDKNRLVLKKKIKLTALTFACRSVLLGFKGSSILLKTIADNISLLNQQSSEILESSSTSTSNVNSYLVKEGYETLTPKEAASLLVSFSNICEISDVLSFDCYSSGEDLDLDAKKKELKLKIIKNFIHSVNPSLCATSVISLLCEEAESNRSNIEYIDALLKLLFNYFNDFTVENVYASTTITLILPELEKIKKGSVSLILNEALSAIEKKGFAEKIDELLFGRFVEFVVDLLIYSSFIINTEEHLNYFKKIVQTWDIDYVIKDDQNNLKKFQFETAQRLSYAVLSLSAHYLRFPPPTPSFSSVDQEENKITFSSESDTNLPTANFGSSKDCVIRICDEEIASLLPVGQFTWNYKSVAPKPEKRIVSDDVSIAENAPKVSDHPTQIAFRNRCVDFADNLYSKHFIESSRENSTGNDGNNSNNTTNENNDNNDNNENNKNDNSNENNDESHSDNNKDSNENDKNVNDNENKENADNNDIFEVFVNHLCSPSDFRAKSAPSLENRSIDEIKLHEEKLPPHSVGPRSAAFLSTLNFFDSQLCNRFFPTIQKYKNVELSDFRHVIHVYFISIPDQYQPDLHFDDFKSGLGLVDDSKESIICADTRHQIVFHLDDQKKMKEKRNIFICWDRDKLVKDEEGWDKTFNTKEQSLRIEICPTHNGLFNVSILLNKNYYQSEFPCLTNVLVSKKNLPAFVISQIIVNDHILDFKKNNVVRAQLQNGKIIRDKRLIDFQSYSLLMKCEQVLLTDSNSNNFSDEEL
ncbi:hypothetical protein M9Y10_028129 [Tritrichomonas musculus]|uniref:Rap-GAP domain-containing protein n=1 Tax=Tritrichomonas musculus TaxID=1915356 RepID=A0ABR2KIM5_9EUKA